MRQELPTLQQWCEQGARFALATVVSTSRSAPRQAGAALALHESGEVVGSVSGGCVEGAVVEVARNVLATGRAKRLSYGISDDEAFAVGLTCGGTIDVFVRSVGPGDDLGLDALSARVQADAPVALATVVDNEDRAWSVGRSLVIDEADVHGSTGSSGLDHAVVQTARGMLALGDTGLCHFGKDGERRMDDVAVMVESFAARPRMIIFGAIDFAAAVASVGCFIGYRVTVCDARERFATPARFPDADEVIVDWPHRYLAGANVDTHTVICVLTHDPKFDVPVLEVALSTPAGYIGVMGSRRTHADRLARLRENGVDARDLARLRSPVGLDLGARTPQETAISIAAELLMDRYGASGVPLSTADGPIHRGDVTRPRAVQS